jgi:peptidoglycan hydrolase-like protein with peptidoglycan-binding domain
MKTLLPLLAAGLLAGASLPALAAETLPMDPEEAIPDNLPRMVEPGPYENLYKQVQQKLGELGFDAGPVNGDFGEKTQAALAQFQLANLLPASGALDEGTLKELGIQRPADPGAADASAATGGTQPADTSDAHAE